MRDDMREAINETVQGLLNLGLPTTFTQKQLDELGVVVPEVEISPIHIREIRQKARLSQTVFAQALNVSASTVRQWEQGKRSPSGSTKVLLELLQKEPHLLDYRIQR
ncbi:MAG: helix-turn-helix domain-containing protein [Anaerolineae bacterium]|jgi:putative transcriptional regulator|nr:helix-turn-helix domain-containing protein [Anaerolineae bacterium]